MNKTLDKTKKYKNYAELPLEKLCDMVANMDVAYEDVACFIESKVYSHCLNGNYKNTINQLKKMVALFETMENKNEENCRDLADIYLLIGEVYQFLGYFKESIEWFKKAAIIDDLYSMPYHALSVSYLELGDIKNAIKSLEQEIQLEPGNYFSYFKLAELYEKTKDIKKENELLKTLIERNPQNIQALHKLILNYEKKKSKSNIDLSLLRKRLLNISNKNLNELEIMIKVYHYCAENKLEEAYSFINSFLAENLSNPTLHLLKAYILGKMHRISSKRAELMEFIKTCYNKTEYIKSKLNEFEQIFGKNSSSHIEKILLFTNLK
jgi:tetratricopeptide (TPR) repeat protein